MKRKILVVATRAKTSGALTVLLEIVNQSKLFNSFEFYFLVNKEIGISINVEDRYCFRIATNDSVSFLSVIREFKFSENIIKSMNIDYILNLGNFIIKKHSCKSGVLVHNSLPYLNAKIKFGFKIFLKATILKFAYKLLMNNPDDVFVQLNWFRDKLISEHKMKNIKTVGTYFGFKVETEPKIEKINSLELIYPSTAFTYKNHKVLFEAFNLISSTKVNITLYLTLESDDLKRLKTEPVKFQNINIVFTGFLKREELLRLMQGKILIAASEIECFPLPIIEAIQLGLTIISLDRPYSREILQHYDSNHMFKNPIQLSEILVNLLNEQEQKVPESLDIISRLNHKNIILEITEGLK